MIARRAARRLGPALAVALAAAGCGSRPDPAQPSGPRCRDLAVMGERLISSVPIDEAEATTRFVAELIDLCQAPGLSTASRSCLVKATTVAAARACPSVPAPADDAGTDQPSCATAVDHVMRLLDADPDLRPIDREERDQQRELYQAECEVLAPRGIRCVLAARNSDAVDRCLGDERNLRHDDLDLDPCADPCGADPCADPCAGNPCADPCAGLDPFGP